MSRNLARCLMRNLLKQNNYVCMRLLPQQLVKRYEHTKKNYALMQNDNTETTMDYQEVKTYREFLNDNVIGHNYSVRTLMNLLDIRRETAIKFTIKWPIFNKLTKPALLKNYQLLRSAGVFKSTIRQNVESLADTPENIQSKVKSLKKVKLEINYGIPLLRLSALELMNFSSTTMKDRSLQPNYRNRIEYLAAKFNCHVSTICVLVCTQPDILSIKMAKIVEITEFLLAQRAGIKEIKPWFIRCPISIIERREEKKINWNTIVGPDTTLEEHIAKVMDCDLHSATSLLYRSPDIKSLSIVKLTKMLQFLHSTGYTIHDLYRAPTIVHRLEDSIRRNYEKWTAAGIGHPNISTLIMSQKRFEEKLQEEIAKSKSSNIFS
ncbi:uncharacterized protein mTTF [Fopius arisanus]|uniref:Uncharacterized protein mTTF n=1 Tax=Fopius arisanus TaxID=64838 RepID=A0A9R1SYT7_9HYME|nr:PREDICTED: uncharacterized protein LOC105264386 [Fopius arisanus]